MIKLGPSGTSGLGYSEAFRACSNIGLKALEVAFTHGVRMQLTEARKIGAMAREHDVVLSIHAPYFINLASKDKEKIVASKKRILDSCERGHYFSNGNKTPIVFHAGYYQDLPEHDVYDIIRDQIIEMNDVISEQGWNVILAPELTGKKTQFGDIDSLIKLSKEAGIGYCIDFAHALARTNGVVDYEEMMKKLPDKFHSHYSGINYGAKGEKNHVLVDIKKWSALVELLQKYKKDITIINESPDPFGDCKKMQKVIDKP